MTTKLYDDTKEVVHGIKDLIEDMSSMSVSTRLQKSPEYGFVWNNHRIFENMDQMNEYRRLLASHMFDHDVKWLATTYKMHVNLFNVDNERVLSAYITLMQIIVDEMILYNSKAFDHKMNLNYSITLHYNKDNELLKGLINRFDSWNLWFKTFVDYSRYINLSWSNQRDNGDKVEYLTYEMSMNRTYPYLTLH